MVQFIKTLYYYYIHNCWLIICKETINPRLHILPLSIPPLQSAWLMLRPVREGTDELFAAWTGCFELCQDGTLAKFHLRGVDHPGIT